MYIDRFNKTKSFICKSKTRLCVFTFLYKYTSLLVGFIYVFSIISCMFSKNFIKLVQMIVIPAATFILGTLVRKLINANRPYELYAIEPIIKKDTIGQSFPSRHMMSVVIITMALLNYNLYLGIPAIILTLSIAIARPVAGVHFIKDIIAGAIFSILCWYLGCYILNLFV